MCCKNETMRKNVKHHPVSLYNVNLGFRHLFLIASRKLVPASNTFDVLIFMPCSISLRFLANAMLLLLFSLLLLSHLISHTLDRPLAPSPNQYLHLFSATSIHCSIFSSSPFRPHTASSRSLLSLIHPVWSISILPFVTFKTSAPIIITNTRSPFQFNSPDSAWLSSFLFVRML